MTQDVRGAPPLARWVSAAARSRFEALRGHPAPEGAGVQQLRDHYDRLNRSRLALAQARYVADVERTVIAGVPAHIVRPRAEANEEAVLLCLHGGAFMWGEGAGALVEAVPVAAVSGLSVIAVEYRLAPEHRHPAAADDVLAVVRDLRLQRPGVRLGLYGCSAGAVLIAQVVARLLAAGDPPPSAVAMLHAAGLEVGGDTLELAELTNGSPDAAAVRRLADLPYLHGADPSDPLVFPGEHPSVLAGFPPALLVTGTRDFAASSVAVMHRRLLAAGRKAELVLFDGMWHAHHVDADLPESAEVFSLLGGFFRRHLG